MRIKIAVVLLANLLMHRMSAQQLMPIDAESSVNFTVSNLGIPVNGTFMGLTGSILFDENNLSQSSFEVSIESSSIETGIGLRNKHLKKEEYFDVANHPRITFSSNSLIRLPEGRFQTEGNLRIKNTTRKIVIPFTCKVTDKRYLFDGIFEVNRQDFDVGGNSITLSDKVIVTLHVTATREND
jgi:polyisoprenoid-binding protein YceI